MTITYEWRGGFDNADVNALHAEGFGHRVLDVDFDDELRPFYFEACGFRPTPAGLIAL
ncbi:hypothetical protein [Streptomyces sp. NRRL B-1347]|uniref:hypothetical protein n=1 Tax=Streptomyces sp. NRRL B-1347 TaxID=1476877 RepID=UPI0018FE6329|nr:hypothetical protein [Streptomyces sp. NRRL B-1347]